MVSDSLDAEPVTIRGAARLLGVPDGMLRSGIKSGIYPLTPRTVARLILTPHIRIMKNGDGHIIPILSLSNSFAVNSEEAVSAVAEMLASDDEASLAGEFLIARGGLIVAAVRTSPSRVVSMMKPWSDEDDIISLGHAESEVSCIEDTVGMRVHAGDVSSVIIVRSDSPRTPEMRFSIRATSRVDHSV